MTERGNCYIKERKSIINYFFEIKFQDIEVKNSLIDVGTGNKNIKFKKTKQNI